MIKFSHEKMLYQAFHLAKRFAAIAANEKLMRMKQTRER